MKLRNNYDESVLDAINRVQLAIKSAGVYPEDHPVTTEIVHNSYEALVNHLNAKSILTLSVHGGKLLVDDTPIESAFALDLAQRAIDSISFHRGLPRRDYLIFIKAMIQKPQSQSKHDDVAAILKKNGVSTIRLNGIKYKKVSGDSDPDVHHHTTTPGDSDKRNSANIISDFDTDPDAERTITQAETGLNERKKSDRRKPVNEPGNKGSSAPDDIQPTELPPDKGTNIKEYINNLLSGRECAEIEALIEDISRKMDDKSGENRKIIAESLQDITSVLDEFDSLKDNFQKISATLINWVKKENQVDTYLAVTKSLQNICSSQSLNKLDSYLMDETIGSRLFEFNELTKTALQEALKARKKNGNSLQYNLGALHLVEETVLTHFLAQQYKDCRIVILSSINHIDEDVLKTIPEKYIRRYQVLPFKAESGSLYTATMNPNDWQLLKDIRFISGYPVIPHLAAEYYLLDSIEKFYNLKSNKLANHQAMSNMQQEDWNSDLELVEETQESVSPGDELKDSDAPIIKLANVIIDEAIKQKASDIHIEPYEQELRVRLRIDGTLITVLNPSKSYANGLVSRIKIVSGLDISERRLPQDGRFKVRKDGKVVDFRVSTFPGIYGEKIVLRLLDNSDLSLDINKLGLNDHDLTTVLSAMYKSKGMILVTGPTGSGKTTTIYSMLRGLNDGTLNISTAEDPVEYNLKGINQFQMNTKIGLNFARALRTFLRQDPDIIMVGEIRDFETAEIAFKAALTGHLVLSTLHTNNAPETIIRLLNIGIEPHIITSSVNLIVAQRLIRKICKKCKVEVVPTEIQINIFRSNGFNIDGRQYCRGEGCEECGNTGYKGRIAVYEVMPLGDEVQEAILRGNSAGEIRAKAEKHGFVSLQTQGFGKVAAGITSLNEWMRVLA
jgi:type IV pilus assembly protein PilB